MLIKPEFIVRMALAMLLMWGVSQDEGTCHARHHTGLHPPRETITPAPSHSSTAALAYGMETKSLSVSAGHDKHETLALLVPAQGTQQERGLHAWWRSLQPKLHDRKYMFRQGLIAAVIVLGFTVILMAVEEAVDEAGEDDSIKLSARCTQLVGRGAAVLGNGSIGGAMMALQISGGLAQKGGGSRGDAAGSDDGCRKQLAAYYYAGLSEAGGWQQDVAAVCRSMLQQLAPQAPQAATQAASQPASSQPPAGGASTPADLMQRVVVMSIDDTALSNLGALLSEDDEDDGRQLAKGQNAGLLPSDRHRHRARQLLLQSSGAPISAAPGAAAGAGAGTHAAAAAAAAQQQQVVQPAGSLRVLAEASSINDDAAAGAAGLVIPSSDTLPPMPAVQHLYKDLQRAGFRVAFVTNRADTGGARAATEANLAAAGYGQRCNTSSADPGSSSSAARGGGGSSSGSSVVCWVELLMRGADDARPASVVKPELRAQLVSQGYTLAAILGDQMSDLLGSPTAPVIFKLPNLLYTVL